MIEIKLVKHLDKRGQLIDLFGLSFGHDTSNEMWNWKYIQNPQAVDDHELVVALDNDKIIGARPFLIIEMWINNNKVRTAQHCDTMVHPEYRNQGIFNRMGQLAIQYLKETGYTLSYGLPNAMSRPGFLKQGYKIVAPTEILFRITNPNKFFRYKLHNEIIGTGLGFIYSMISGAGRDKDIYHSSSSYEIEICDQVTNQFHDLDDLRDKSVIDLVRSKNNLQWRFDRHPKHKYQYILIKRGEVLEGYAVVSIQKLSENITTGILIDYLVRNRDAKCGQILLSKSLEVLEQLGCDIVITWACNEPSLRNSLLDDFGFKSSFKFPYNKFAEIRYLDALLIDNKIANIKDIYEEESWRVTPAFHDIR
jgi:GNAT superfamily N-acetyltransferase